MIDAAAFYAQVGPPDANGCRRWLGAMSSTGYGTVTVDLDDGRGPRTVGAHRVSYMLASGKPIPPKGVICHSCDHRWCVAEEHLSLGTTRSNALERADRHRGRGQRRGCDGSPIPEGRKLW